MSKNVAENFQETSDLLQAVFDSAPNGIAVMQNVYDESDKVEDFSILLFNAYTLNWIGDIEYRGKRYGDLFPMVKETGILEKFIAVAETGISANFERWYSGEGMNHWFRFTAVKQGELLVVTTEDITATRKAEEALRKSEEFNRTTLESSPDCIKVLDTQGGLTYMNYNGTCIMEIDDFSTVKNKSWWELWPDDSKEEVKAAIAKALNGKTAQFQAFCPTAKGTPKWWDVVVSPIASAEGSILQLISVSRDITEGRKAAEALRESESRFRALVNASSDVIYRLNADWTIMYPLDGRGFLSDAQAPVTNWMEKNVHPSEFDTVRRTIAAAIANKSVFELEHRVITADGTVGWTFSKAVPLLDQEGNIVEWFGTASDITTRKMAEQALKESESRFRTMADVVPQILWTARADGSIDYYNKVWYEYTGSHYSTETAENTWASFIHPEDLPEMTDVWNRSIGNEVPYHFEFRLKEAKTGEYRWFLAKAVPVRDADGKLIKWFGATGDIHEQKVFTEKLEQEVAERTKELQRSNEDLQQFAHVASHDLKEPVRKVQTFLSRLEQHLDGKLDETGRRFTERIHSAAARMNTMIDGVLVYSTINAYTQTPQPVDLNDVLKNIETDLEVIIQRTSTQIKYAQLPVIEGASVLLYQLFYNLINNAIKFARAGIAPQITITSEIIMDDKRQFAKLTLSDNGIGFEQGQEKMIFDTFTRLNSKDKFEGTGLGLALCKKIVERHGGRISASGIPGEGAAFTIWLPVKQIEHSI